MKTSELNDLLVEAMNGFNSTRLPNAKAEDYPAIKAGMEDLQAMSQPITPAALVAAGWEQASGDDMVYLLRVGWLTIEVEFNIAGEATVTIDLPDAKLGILFRGISTMHDIGELARLLGGVK